MSILRIAIECELGGTAAESQAMMLALIQVVDRGLSAMGCTPKISATTDAAPPLACKWARDDATIAASAARSQVDGG